MFHVKHPPVEELPPALGTTLNEMMHLGIDDLHGERCAGIRDLSPNATVEMDTAAIRTAEPNPESTRFGIRQFAENREFLSLGPNQSLRLTWPERPATTQEKQGFEDAGLAGSIFARDQVDACVGRKLYRLQASEIIDLDLLKAQIDDPIEAV